MAGGIDWFRWHHGSVTDPKFQLVARKAGVRLPDVLAVWAFVLEKASASDDRGTFGGLDCEAIDCLFGLEDGQTALILEQMQARDLVQDGEVVAWEKRQPKRERPDDNSTERSRAFRAKQANATPCNATQRQETPRGEESREEIKEVVLPSEQSAPEVEGFKPTPSGQVGQALKRAGISMASVSLPDPRINALLEQGATPEEFEAVAREAVERQIAKPIGWICSTLAGRRSDAAKLTLAPAQPTTADRMAWRKTTDGVLAMGQELGVQNREADTWEAYERRVLSAFQRREAAKETS